MANVPSLSTRALNRALLARQHLLARTQMSVSGMVEHLVGMQAQVPVNPYYALWSRLVDFRPESLAELILSRQAVRLSLLRTTLHLVTARDALTLRPVVQGVLDRGYASGSPFHKNLVGMDLDEVTAAGRELLHAEALTTAELGARLAERWPDRDAQSLAYAVRYLVPMVQVPPRGVWGRSGAPRWRTLETWLERPLEPSDEPDGMVLRYLAAFGPASVADIATWSWLTRVREVVERLRPRLRVYRSETGSELFDVEDGPMPDPDTRAPARFLPEYDNVELSHADRRRIIAPEAVGAFTGYVGTFLVDGFVAGQWRIDRGKEVHRLILQPFVRLADDESEQLVTEGERLLAWDAGDVAAERELTAEFGIAHTGRR
jgi:hypothetical protein